jgi:hypothetical protein
MRSLAIAAVALLAVSTTADAKRSSTKPKASAKVAAKREPSKKLGDVSTRRPSKRDGKNKKGGKQKVALAAKRSHHYVMPRGPLDGQSLGAPWAGALREPAMLEPGDGYVIRRPWRAYGTSQTVETVERIVSDVAERFYDTHPIAIGDISAESGGRITDHSSHQSGRDIDIGLIFKQKPEGYPESFIVGTQDNLDLEATFVLVEEFAKTAKEPGGVQMMFLDFNLQKLLYDWALENGENPDYLATLFQYPHGRGSCAGIVRHEPNHADHVHVRFQCPPGDSLCK